MKGVLVDSNVILDLFLDDHTWAIWSECVLEKQRQLSRLFINPVIYSEISIAFERIEELETISGFPSNPFYHKLFSPQATQQL